MQKRNIRMLVLTAALASATAVGLAKLQQNFSDIPAGHWASEAVQAIAAEGLITGYQDGTFQGQKTLTRYEAATIFYRLLKSGKLQQATPATQTTVQQGMAEVSPELAELKTQISDTNDRLTALEDQVKTLGTAPAATTTTTPAAPATDTTALEARIKTLEDDIAALKAAPAAPASTTTSTAPATLDPAVEARIKSLEDDLAALKTAAAAPSTSSSDLETRVKALEDKVAAAPTAPAAPAPTTTAAPATLDPAVEARIAALETKVAAAPDTTALQATVTSQDTRITTLETQLAALQTKVDGLSATAAVTPPAAPTVPVTTGSSATTDTSSGPTTSFSVGLGGAINLVGPVGTGASPLGIYGQLAINRIAGPFGIRAFADLSSIPAAGAQILLNLGDNGFDPYIGIGGGVIFNNPTNFFIGGSVGANLGFGGGLGVFAEVNPRYNLSASQFSVKAAFGLRFAF